MSGSFAALARDLAKVAMSIAGDLTVTCVYSPAGTLTYDPATGNTSNSASPLTFKALYTRFGPNEVDGKTVIQNDARLIVAGTDLGVLPNENDTIQLTMSLPNGGSITKTAKVLRSQGTPGAAVYRIHIREV